MGMAEFKLRTPTLKGMPLYIGELLRTPTQNVSHVYRRTFAYPYAKCLPCIQENFCVPLRKIFCICIILPYTILAKIIDTPLPQNLKIETTITVSSVISCSISMKV